MKFKDLSITQKRKLAFALLKDKDRNKIFHFNSTSSTSSSSIPFKFADIPTQRRELKLKAYNSPIDKKIKDITPLMNMILEYTHPRGLRADSNEELKREVNIWYNVMYLNKDQKGRDLKTPQEIKEAKQMLLRRVGHISEWDVSRVTDMSNLFSEQYLFNHDISRWNVSEVTNMQGMFDGAGRFNQSLNQWNVSKVTNMESMFDGAISFDQPLNNWERKQGVNGATSTSTLSNVTNMNLMFNRARSFNQPLDQWNVSEVTNMNRMFAGTSGFDQPLNNWDVSSVTNMGSMFRNAMSFNQPLNNWNVSNVTNMELMFFGARSFNQPLNNWERKQGVDGATSTSTLSKVITMYSMFFGARSFNQPLSQWNVSNVENMNYMFYNARSFNQDLNTHEERKYDYTISLLFNNNRMFSKLDEKIRNNYVDSFTRNNVTFQSLLNKEVLIDIDTFKHYLKTNNIHMRPGHSRRLFRYLKRLHGEERDVKGSRFSSHFPPIPYNSYTAWDVSNVTNMGVMFTGADSLEQLPTWYDELTNRTFFFSSLMR